MDTSTKERIVYRGKLFELVHEDFKQPNGVRTFEFARRGPGTRILLISTDNQMLLTREYRRELGYYDIRLPGGKVFDTLVEYEAARLSSKSLQEFAKDAAKRELEEETGFRAEELDFFDISKCGATIEWDLYYYICRRWNPPINVIQSHEDEDISVLWTSFSEAKQLCLKGTITEERSAIRILRYINNLGIIS